MGLAGFVLFDDVEWTVFDFAEDFADVFAEDADEEHVETAEKEDGGHDGCVAGDIDGEEDATGDEDESVNYGGEGDESA